MSIQITTKGYNMCKVSISEALTLNTKVKVGIEDGEMYVTPSVTNLT